MDSQHIIEQYQKAIIQIASPGGTGTGFYLKEFDLNYTKSKLVIFNKIYGKNKKDAPYDMLTDEVRSCCSNIKSCLSNLTNGHINHFKVTEKNINNSQSVLHLFSFPH